MSSLSLLPRFIKILINKIFNLLSALSKTLGLRIFFRFLFFAFEYAKNEEMFINHPLTIQPATSGAQRFNFYILSQFFPIFFFNLFSLHSSFCSDFFSLIAIYLCWNCLQKIELKESSSEFIFLYAV